ncbi:release factor glutamine methyltransferase [Salinibacillus kushneri]|uniref:Release factor glutamine methyltransferase n=1 Tax=Salinibacillus kushneri TaxID=237682 RepID=A0A1I0CVD9_9BACI|nr:release factor glutamine methyltransferase [Salinibacillus kushneri]
MKSKPKDSKKLVINVSSFANLWEARRWASLFLKEHNREEGVADLLLMDLMSMSKSQILAAMRDDFPQEVQAKFIERIYQHVDNGTPVQHLIGYEYFYGRKFKVNRDVLIPRPETEELVHLVLKQIEKEFDEKEPAKVIDVGAGSGIIGITMKKENPALDVQAVDISRKALEVAKVNAKNLMADVRFVEGDFLTPFIDVGAKADVVISNPPYISADDEDSLDDVVRLHDPKLALFAEDDGLAAYKKIMYQLPQVVNGKALVAFEIGDQQGAAVQKLMKAVFPKSEPEIVQDINKKDRIVYAWI